MYDFARVRALPHFHPAYLTDWATGWLFYGLGSLIKTVPVFERDFVPNDPLIQHPHTKQRISGSLLFNFAVYIPLLIVVVISALQRSWIGMHHGALGLFLAVSSQKLIVCGLKNRVGRLRPDFMARCKWNASLRACTGEALTIQDGRQSFPSGHTSLAFAGLTFLSIYLGGYINTPKTNSASSRMPSFLESKALRFAITLLPLGLATWIAVTRLEDYRHHAEDVIAGALIGFACASVSYFIYWQNPFSGNSGPRVVYLTGVPDLNDGYELAHMEDPTTSV